MEKVIMREKISGDTKTYKKNYHRNKKNKDTNNKKTYDKYDDKYDDLVLRSGEVTTLSIYGNPKMAGSYMIGKNNFIYLKKKPNIIHRFFSKILLGWIWKDVK
jgi:hypothetical protein